MRSETSENRKNTEFATILEMGLREAYAGRALAVVVSGAACRWVRVVEGPTGAPLEVNF